MIYLINRENLYLFSFKNILFNMNKDELNNKLKELKIEDFIWCIYLGIILLSWYANNLERKYFIFNDLKSKEKYRKIIILIFSILVIIYLYFLTTSYKDFKNIKNNDSVKKKNLLFLSFISSLLIVISGLILLYIAIVDEEVQIEIAFN